MNKFAWNRVYCTVMELKRMYIQEHGNDGMYDKGDYPDVISFWADNVSNPKYRDIFHLVQIGQYGDFCILKYKGYNAIFGEMEYEEFWEAYDQFYRYCRGVTIDVVNDELVLCAYDKFFNINELPETSTEAVIERLKRATIIEITDKLDGSLQMAHWYNGKVVLSGSTSVNPEESYRVANGLRFISEHKNYQEMIQENSDLCFIFESIMPDDPHVVVYDYEKTNGLYLTGVRDIYTGRVYDWDEVACFIRSYGVLSTHIEGITFEEMMNSRGKYKCDEKEGWVLNIDGWRVKIKCDDFMTFHGILSGMRKNSNRLGSAILEAMQLGMLDDFLSSLPKRYHQEAMGTIDTISAYCKKLDDEVHDYIDQYPGDLTDRKSFMIWVDGNVPSDFRGYVRNTYLGFENDYLKRRKFKDIVDVPEQEIED